MTMLVSCVFATPTLAFADPTVYTVGNSKEFDSAVADINVNGKTGEDYVIKLTDDIESNAVSFNSDCTTTILGNGHTITLGEGETHFGVSRGAHLNLGSTDGRDRLTIKGRSEQNVQNSDAPGLLYIMGSCDMYAGVTLTDREGNNYFGGGVTVFGGTFHMHGGAIENCASRAGRFATAAASRWPTAARSLWMMVRSQAATRSPTMWTKSTPLGAFAPLAAACLSRVVHPSP